MKEADIFWDRHKTNRWFTDSLQKIKSAQEKQRRLTVTASYGALDKYDKETYDSCSADIQTLTREMHEFVAKEEWIVILRELLKIGE